MAILVTEPDACKRSIQSVTKNQVVTNGKVPLGSGMNKVPILDFARIYCMIFSITQNRQRAE